MGHSGAETSLTGATSGLTHSDLCKLRASMNKAYEDAKVDAIDVKALLLLNEQFSQPLSLRRASQAALFQHLSPAASTDFVTHASFAQCDPNLTIYDPVGPVKTKVGQRWQQGFDPEVKRTSRTEERGRAGILGSKGPREHGQHNIY